MLVITVYGSFNCLKIKTAIVNVQFHQVCKYLLLHLTFKARLLLQCAYIWTVRYYKRCSFKFYQLDSNLNTRPLLNSSDLCEDNIRQCLKHGHTVFVSYVLIQSCYFKIYSHRSVFLYHDIPFIFNTVTGSFQSPAQSDWLHYARIEGDMHGRLVKYCPPIG